MYTQSALTSIRYTCACTCICIILYCACERCISSYLDTCEYIISTYIHVHIDVAIYKFSHGVIKVGLALVFHITISLFMMYIDHG